MTLTIDAARALIDQQLEDQDATETSAAAAGWSRPLTARELQIIELLCEGMTRVQMGERLGISALTVKSHLARIREVTGQPDQAGIVGACFRAGAIR